MYDDGSFTQNVSDAFADCAEGEIKFLTTKHNIQTAFRRCGSNKFSHFKWSPDGIHLFFQLTHGAHLMNGLEKTISVVPTESPVHNAGWLTKDILALPLQAAEGDTRDRVVIYNRAEDSMHTMHLNASAPRHLQPWNDTGTIILLTAVDAEGSRRPFTLDTASGELKRILPWLNQPIEELHANRKADVVGWSTAKDSEVARLSDGKTLHLLPGVTRAVPDPTGDWFALELLGEPISHFDQKAWGQGTEEQRARNEARRDEWISRQPEWVSKEVPPPEIHLLNTKDGGRYRITAFYGDRVQWYPAKPLHLAFMMWGIEGKQLNRNVAFSDMRERVRMVTKGETPIGVEILNGPKTATAPTPRTSN